MEKITTRKSAEQQNWQYKFVFFIFTNATNREKYNNQFTAARFLRNKFFNIYNNHHITNFVKRFFTNKKKKKKAKQDFFTNKLAFLRLIKTHLRAHIYHILCTNQNKIAAHTFSRSPWLKVIINGFRTLFVENSVFQLFYARSKWVHVIVSQFYIQTNTFFFLIKTEIFVKSNFISFVTVNRQSIH